MARWGGPIFRRKRDYPWRKRRRRLPRITAATVASLALSSTGAATTGGSLAVQGPTTLSATGAATSGGSLNVGRVWSSAIASTGTATSSGSANAAIVGPYPIPVSVGTDNRLVDQFGNTILLKVVSSWGFAMRATNSEITAKLEEWAALGVNCVNFAFCGGVDSQSDWDAVQYKNQAGQNFFTGTPFQSSLGAAFGSTDWIVQECDRLGMIAMLALFVSYGDTGVKADIEAATTTQMRSFGQAVGARYNDYGNVIWEIEADNGWGAGDACGRAIDYLARGIDEGRTAYNNMWFAEAYANAPDSMGMFLDVEGTDPTGYQWLHLDANGLYWYGTDHVDVIDAAFQEAVTFSGRDIALWDSEPGYAQADQYTQATPVGGTTQTNQPLGVRQRTISVFIRGGSGINWGHERWWPFDLTGLFLSAQPPDWHDVPSSTEAIQYGYVNSIVDAYCTANGFGPTSAFVTSGQGTATHEVAQGAGPTSLLAYFPSGTTNGSTARSITVDTTQFPGTGNVRLRWFDLTNGNYTSIAASEAQNSSRSVTLPSARGDGTRDFLLVVDAPDFTLSATGLAQSGGSLAVAVRTTATASGAATSGGSLAAVIQKPLTATGAATTAGSLAVGGANTLAATGASTTGGSLAVVINKPLTATGAATTGGSVDATITSGSQSYALASTGIAQSGGSLAVGLPGVSASGAAGTGGSVAVAVRMSAGASGAATTNGSLAVSQTSSLSASGAATSGGSCAATISPPAGSNSLAATGFAQSGGSLAVTAPNTLSSSGLASSGGSVAFTAIYPLTATGAATTGGYVRVGINGITVPPEAFDVSDIYGRDQPTIVGTDDR